MPQPILRPQDVVVLAKLFAYRGHRPPMAQISVDLSISASEIHAALKRLAASHLVSTDGTHYRPLPDAVLEFFLHGLEYAFPASRGELTRGVATSYAAPPLNKKILAGADLPPVWPYPEGKLRGGRLNRSTRPSPSRLCATRSCTNSSR